MRYTLQVESLWEDEWLPLGSSVGIDAETPGAALALIDTCTIRMREGVYYLISCTDLNGTRRTTAPVCFPALPAEITESQR